MRDKRTKNRKKLQHLLRDLFQFDHADLDFGIYRIMNEKREEVERFIEQDLLDVVEEALVRFRDVDREEMQAELAEAREQLAPEAFDADGAVRQQFRGLGIAQRYMELREKLGQTAVAAETEAHVFNDLWRFFSRYYDQGDFLTERRYSSRGAKYCVPYNGEEVMLHWANRDQYYVKTAERFTDYRFTTGEYTVWFRLGRAEVPQDNVKSDTRYFVLHEELPISYDAETRTLTIPFAYRPLTQEEEAHYLGVYNAQQSKSNSRKTLDRSVLCAALETEILEALDPAPALQAGADEADLKAALAASPRRREQTALGLLGRHLNRYTARHTMDYFVHKDLGGFLRRELDVFLKTEVMRLGDLMADEAGEMALHTLTRMRVVRHIAHRIIDFLAQIEGFQKRLFEKQKFVVQTDYCVTLDRVPEAFYPEVLANEAQLDEWRRLYRTDEWENDLFWRGDFNEAFLQNHPYLMIDTALFDEDFKARLLASFDDLGGATDGLLIHGENFQALNLLMAKYRERVKCIYIDPPYNTGNDEFLYKDRYRHSSWLSMMRDRLDAGWRLLQSNGALFTSIDGNERDRLSTLADTLYGSRSYLNTFVWINNLKGRQISGRGAAGTHEYVLAYGKDDVGSFSVSTSLAKAIMPSAYKGFDYEIREDDIGPYVVKNELYNTNSKFNEETRPNLVFNIYWNPDSGEIRFSEVDEEANFEGFIKIPPKENNDGIHKYHAWRWSKDKIMEEAHDLWFRRSEDRVRIYTKVRGFDTTALKDVITDIPTDAGTRDLSRYLPRAFFGNYPKPTELVGIFVGLAEGDDLVLDYFAGSGTTAHAVMNLNREDGGDRKYILVEMGDYFDTVLKPRILKVAFSANWRDGVPQDRDGVSHVVKYHRIESYEDALNNIRVRRPEGGQLELLQQFEDYMLHYMLDFETRDSPSLLAQEAFERPFDYTLKIQRGHESPEDTPVDLVETFHYLIGMHVKRLERYEHQGRTYVVSRGDVRTERGIERVVTIWRDTEGLDLEQEADWVNAELLTDLVDRVYVNGYENFIHKAEPTEITFRKRMEGGIA